MPPPASLEAGGGSVATWAMPQKDSGCKRCITKNDIWKQCLTHNSHGCSACKKVFDASTWSAKMIKNHRQRNTDLVCADCRELGYGPNRYDEHQCEECCETFGSLKFDRKLKYNKKRREGCRLVCKACRSKIRCSACRSKIRCSACNRAYEPEYWSKCERKNHFSTEQTKLVCKACRAQGFTPWSVKEYTCETCAGKFGAKLFDRTKLHNFQAGRRKMLHCLQCERGSKVIHRCSVKQ